MKILRFIPVSVFAVMAFGAVELVQVRQAHAVVGRPLTPVSVAGVARRTTRRTARRCANGLYQCRVDTPDTLKKTMV